MISDPPRSIADIVKDVLANLQEIVRSEVRLAKAELRIEIGQMRSASLLLGVGAVTGGLSLVFGLLAALYALALLMPHWAAALLIAGVLAVVAGFLLALGIRRIKHLSALPVTTTSLKKDAQWAKHPTG